MWRVAGPSEYLAITGGSIKDVKLAKKAWIWPTQKCVEFCISPVNYAIEMQAMSADKVPFFIHAVFTIGPRITDHESLLLYAKLFASHVKSSCHVKELVQRLIKGQTCVIAPSMTTEYISNEVLKKLQLELNQFGLVIYNVNLVDAKAKMKMVETKVTGTEKIIKNQKQTELAKANAHVAYVRDDQLEDLPRVANQRKSSEGLVSKDRHPVELESD